MDWPDSRLRADESCWTRCFFLLFRLSNLLDLIFLRFVVFCPEIYVSCNVPVITPMPIPSRFIFFKGWQVCATKQWHAPLPAGAFEHKRCDRSKIVTVQTRGDFKTVLTGLCKMMRNFSLRSSILSWMIPVRQVWVLSTASNIIWVISCGCYFGTSEVNVAFQSDVLGSNCTCNAVCGAISTFNLAEPGFTVKLTNEDDLRFP